MLDKFEAILDYKGKRFTFLIDINPHKLEKFVDDSLDVFDTLLRHIVSLERYGEPYSATDDAQKVAVDTAIENLKDG